MAGDEDWPLDPQALARAEAALDALADRYLAWAEADLARLRAALAADDPHTLFAIAHDMKGQASTFGFPLVTDLANRLCRHVEAHPDDRARTALLVELMAQAIGHRLAGDGGEQARALLARLD